MAGGRLLGVSFQTNLQEGHVCKLHVLFLPHLLINDNLNKRFGPERSYNQSLSSKSLIIRIQSGRL